MSVNMNNLIVLYVKLKKKMSACKFQLIAVLDKLSCSSCIGAQI